MPIKRVVRQLLYNLYVGLTFLAVMNFTLGIPTARLTLAASEHGAR